MRNLYFLLFLLISVVNSNAQGISYSNFSLSQIESNVSVTWAIDSGSICDGVKLEHSLDGINFTVIDEVIGVCGSSFETKSYNLIDEFPEKNKDNFYRLFFGFSQRSQILSLFVRFVIPGEIQVFPMPAESDFRIYFSNPANALTNLKIHNESGVLVFQQESISDDFIELNKSGFVSGIYYVRFISENRAESLGKMIIQ